MTYRLAGAPLGLLMVSLMFLSGGGEAIASDAKFAAQLIWATNDKKCDDPKLKPVDEETRKKLKELPLKWENYFLVKRDQVVVAKGGTNSVVLSEKCTVEVKRLGDKKVEVSLHGKKGELCYKRTEPLPKDKMLVLGGNAPNATAWLVTLKRTE